MATMAAYSAGFETVTFRPTIRLGGLPKASAALAMATAAAAWIAISLVAVGTVSEGLTTVGFAVHESSLAVRPLTTTLAPSKRPDRFERLSSVADAPSPGLTSEAIRLSRQNKATAAVARRLAAAAAELQHQRFVERFRLDAPADVRIALAVRHDGMAAPDAGPQPPPMVAAIAPLPAERPPVITAPGVAPEAPKLASLQRDEEKPRTPALTPAPKAPPAPVAVGSRPGVAVYDITAGVVHMPNGDKLEAHSGLGDYMDDIRYVHVRMRGPTPPGTYKLTMRESRFHGVEAIRLTPVDGKKPFGRDGLLAHTYMLRKPGESNGCVSFRDYPRFLNAFKRGEVKQLVVVASMAGSTAPKKKTGLLSWLGG